MDHVEGGRSNRERLESRLERAEKKGRPDIVREIEAKLASPPFPEGLRYVWEMFNDLRRRKAPGQHGPDPIEWHDIIAFSKVTGTRVAPWEAGLIVDLDDLYLAHRFSEQSRNGKPGLNTTPDNPDGVKALMGDVGRKRITQRRQKQ